MTSRRDLLAAAALAATPGMAMAQPRTLQGPEFPDRPVRVIVPYAAGGGNDLLARIYGQKLTESLGQPFVVDNRPGGGAVIGSEAVIRAKPDGHTLLVHASGPVLWEKGATRPAYDRQADLTPIAILGRYAGMLLVKADSPFRSVADLVAWLRANPDRGNFSNGGTGFQLLGAFFAQRTGTKIESVTYRNSVEAVSALAAGDVTIAISDPGPAQAAIDAGRVRPLVVSSSRRVASFPDIPIMAEAGVPDLVVDYWIGLFGPAGLPPEVLRRLAEGVRQAAATPDVRQKLALASVEPGDLDPEAFRRAIVTNDAVWADVARRAGISLER